MQVGDPVPALPVARFFRVATRDLASADLLDIQDLIIRKRPDGSTLITSLEGSGRSLIFERLVKRPNPIPTDIVSTDPQGLVHRIESALGRGAEEGGIAIPTVNQRIGGVENIPNQSNAPPSGLRATLSRIVAALRGTTKALPLISGPLGAEVNRVDGERRLNAFLEAHPGIEISDTARADYLRLCYTMNTPIFSQGLAGFLAWADANNIPPHHRQALNPTVIRLNDKGVELGLLTSLSLPPMAHGANATHDFSQNPNGGLPRPSGGAFIG